MLPFCRFCYCDSSCEMTSQNANYYSNMYYHVRSSASNASVFKTVIHTLHFLSVFVVTSHRREWTSGISHKCTISTTYNMVGARRCPCVTSPVQPGVHASAELHLAAYSFRPASGHAFAKVSFLVQFDAHTYNPGMRDVMTSLHPTLR